MTIPELTAMFGWATLINLAYLVLASVTIMLFQKQLINLHRRFFALDEQSLSLIYLKFLSHYKAMTLVFFVAPYLALKVIAS